MLSDWFYSAIDLYEGFSFPRFSLKQFLCWHDYKWKTEGGLGEAYGYEVCEKCKKVRP
jgi:hypothetical protein